MSAAAFIQYLHQVHAESTIPTFTSALPSVDSLHEKAWQSSFVFLFKDVEQRSPSDTALAAVSTDAFLRSVLSAGWPERADNGLPLLEVSTCVLARDEPIGSGFHSADHTKSGGAPWKECLVASRYELVSTVFAIERFSVVGVPVDTRCVDDGGASPPSPSSAGMAEYAGPTVLGSQEMSVAQEEERSLRALRAANAVSSAFGGELTQLSFFQKQSVRVLLTVCRVISTAGGTVPDSVTASRHLQSLSNFTASSYSRRGLSSRFHAFLNSAVPFLGVDEQRRQTAWEQLQTKCKPVPTVNQSTAGGGSNGFPSERDGAALKSNVNTTVTSNNTSAMSEQGQTPGEGSRQPSNPQTQSARHGDSDKRRGGGAGSVNSSVTSCEGGGGGGAVPAAAAALNKSSIQVRWGLAGESSTLSGGGREGSAGSTGSWGEAASAAGAAAGPVGVTPLPSLSRAAGGARPPSAAANSSAVGGSTSSGGAAVDPYAAAGPTTESEEEERLRGDSVLSQVYAECAPYFTPTAMAQRRSHLHWQLDAVESVFVECPPYSHRPRHCGGGDGAEEVFSVSEGWQRWAAACSGGLSRPLIINSMDDIVAYCESSRQAFFCAVSMLDYFVVRTASDPPAVCVAFQNFKRANRLQPQQAASLAGTGGRGRPGERQGFGPGAAGSVTDASDKDISAFFTQVICVCCMLGCKMKDTYPPMLKKLLACLNSNSDDGALSDVEFTLMELFLLQKVFQFEHLSEVVTVNEVVDLLLFLVGGDTIKELAEFNCYSRLLKRRGAEADWLAAQVPLRIMKAETGLCRGRQDYLDAVESTVAAAAAPRHERQCPRPLRKYRQAVEKAEEEESRERGGAGDADEGGILRGGDAQQWRPTAGPRTPSLNKVDVREWHRLSLLARFLSDLAVRGPKNSSGAEVRALMAKANTNGSRQQRKGDRSEQAVAAELERQAALRLQCGALEVSPCALGVAVLAVTAEVLRVPLPVPLFAIMPEGYKRSLAQSGLAPRPVNPYPKANHHREGAGSGGGENEESLLGVLSQPPPPQQQQQQRLLSSSSSSSSSPSHSNCFPVKPRDDHYLVLAHFCALFARAQQQQQRQLRVHCDSTGSVCGGSPACLDGEGGYSLSSAASLLPQHCSLDVERAMEEVHKVYRESKEGSPCDPILRKRYKEMLSL